MTINNGYIVDKACGRSRRVRIAMLQVIGQLLAGGFGTKMSKMLGTAVYLVLQGDVQGAATAAKTAADKDVIRCGMRVDPNEFDSTLPTLYTKGELVDMFAKTVELSAVKVAKKEEDMTKQMLNNVKWIGAQHRMDCPLTEFKPSFALMLYKPTDEASNVWVMSITAGAWRWGPIGTCLPGLPSLIQASSDDVPMWILLVKADEILGQGVSLRDAKQFLETPSGTEAVKRSVLFRCEKGSVIFCPAGWIMMPITVEPPLADATTVAAKKRGKAKVTSDRAIANVRVMTLFVPEWMKNLTLPTLTAICNWNTDYSATKIAEKQWAARHSFMVEFAKECGVASVPK
jgi:hypothetical protein